MHDREESYLDTILGATVRMNDNPIPLFQRVLAAQRNQRIIDALFGGREIEDEPAVIEIVGLTDEEVVQARAEGRLAPGDE